MLISYIVRTFQIEWLSLQGLDALSKLQAFVEMSLFVLIEEKLVVNCWTTNKEALLKEAKTFGLAFLGDGATVKRMALLNILGMCGNTPPITVSIQDCTQKYNGLDFSEPDNNKTYSIFEENMEY